MTVSEYKPHNTEDRGFYVYRLWELDSDNQPVKCLYVGRSIQPHIRVRQHLSKDWCPDIIGVDVASCSSYEEMCREEIYQIRELTPVNNTQRYAGEKDMVLRTASLHIDVIRDLRKLVHELALYTGERITLNSAVKICIDLCRQAMQETSTLEVTIIQGTEST